MHVHRWHQKHSPFVAPSFRWPCLLFSIVLCTYVLYMQQYSTRTWAGYIIGAPALGTSLIFTAMSFAPKTALQSIDMNKQQLITFLLAGLIIWSVGAELGIVVRGCVDTLEANGRRIGDGTESDRIIHVSASVKQSMQKQSIEVCHCALHIQNVFCVFIFCFADPLKQLNIQVDLAVVNAANIFFVITLLSLILKMPPASCVFLLAIWSAISNLSFFLALEAVNVSVRVRLS